MYSWEIENLLKLRNYLVSREEYIKVTNSKENPQVNHVKYDCNNDVFQIDTTDSYHFKVKIKR